MAMPSPRKTEARAQLQGAQGAGTYVARRGGEGPTLDHRRAEHDGGDVVYCLEKEETEIETQEDARKKQLEGWVSRTR